MPQRFLRPGLTTSDRWNGVSFPSQSLFIRLLTLVDDYGRYDARPALVKSHAFPVTDISREEVTSMLEELHNANLLTLYTVDGKAFLQVCRWEERARAASKYPPPPNTCKQLLAIDSKCMPPSPSPSPSPIAIVADAPASDVVVFSAEQIARATPQPQPLQDEPEQVKALHEHFCNLTGAKLTPSYQRNQTWREFIARGFTADDLTRVVKWLHGQIARGQGGFSKQSLQFQTLLQDVDRFEDKLATARQSKVAGISPPAAPRPEPEGWREWVAEHFSGKTVTTWAALPDSVKAEFRAARLTQPTT